LGSGYNRPPGDFVWFVGETPLGSAGGSDRGHQNIGPKRKNTSPQIRWIGGGKTTTEGAARCQHSFSHYFISSIPLLVTSTYSGNAGGIVAARQMPVQILNSNIVSSVSMSTNK